MGVKARKMTAAFMIMLLFFCTGCSGAKEEEHYDIEFTVCSDTKLPEELLDIINEKKSKEFKLSYVNNNYMYIAVGYGEMPRANYNVAVERLYATSQAIYFETNLFTEEYTPTDALGRGDSSMYPYIVVKCEKYDVPVIYKMD